MTNIPMLKVPVTNILTLTTAMRAAMTMTTMMSFHDVSL